MARPDAAPLVYVSGNGPNISLFRLDVHSATLEPRGTIPAGEEATFLAVSPDRRYLYAVNERAPSRVIAFAIEPDGGLREINRHDTSGSGAPHLAVHPSGRWIAVAHYGSGHVSTLPVAGDGSVAAPISTSRGPSDDCERAHQVVFDAAGKHLFVPCLGSDCVLVFRFVAGTLVPHDPPLVPLTGGPRHLALHDRLPYAYVLSELDGTLTRFRYERELGRLSEPRTLPSYAAVAGWSAHVALHPSGRWLYTSNRNENSLALFALDAETGMPAPVAFERHGLTTPRHFTLDPTGSLLLAANQDGEQDVVVFRVSATDGRLAWQRTVPVGSRPTCVVVTSPP